MYFGILYDASCNQVEFSIDEEIFDLEAINGIFFQIQLGGLSCYVYLFKLVEFTEFVLHL